MWVGVGKDQVGPKAPTAFHNRMRSIRMQMKVMARRVLYGFLLVCWWIPPSHPAYGSENSPWERIEEGLHLGTFDAPKKSEIGDSKITVLKADPNLYSLKLLCASEHDWKKLTLKEWCRRFQLLAGVNAGMYQEDGFTSVGYMKNFLHFNNPRLNGNNTILAFNPIDPSLPGTWIIDRECHDFHSLKKKYQTMIQSIRMISCRQENVWSSQEGKWSIVAFGIDSADNLLFLFSQSPFSVHDFIDNLLTLPLSIRSAMYLEGGPQAGFYLSVGDTEMEKHGNVETGFGQTSMFHMAWPIPNVLGLVRKSKEAS